MIYTGKNDNAGEFDIVVRVGKFPQQGKKLVIQKGSTIISVSGDDVNDLCQAIQRVANIASKLTYVAQFDDAPNPFDAAWNSADYCSTCPAR